MKKFIPYILIAWSLLAFVGYNVLTVEASSDKQSIQKEMCEVNYEAKWKDGECQFPYQNGPVNDRLEYEEDMMDKGKGIYEDYAQRQEERAADEDAKCDDEDADSTNIKLCMSEEREHHWTDQQIEKKVCEDEGYKWAHNGGCDTKGDTKKWDEVYSKVGQKLAEREEEERQEEAKKEIVNIIKDSEPMNNYPITQKPIEEIEDWSNTVSETTNTNEQEYFEAQAESINTPYTEEDEENLKEIAQKIANSESEVHGNAEIDYTETEDSSDNTDSSDSQDSSDSEDNSSDDGGDSSDSGDDSSSSDDGGDSGDSSESEE